MEKKGEFINPDAGKEVTGGLINTGLFMGGIFIYVIGIIVLISTRNAIIGILFYLLATGVLGYSIKRNLKSKHGKVFRILNILTKGFFMLVFTIWYIFMIIAAATF